MKYLSYEEAFDRLNGWVAKEVPFSLLRFGDGEGLFAFNNMGSDRLKKASMKHWGVTLGHWDQVAISVNLKRAYKECNLAGLPYDFEGHYWDIATKSFLSYWREKEICSAGIHIEFGKTNILEEYIDGRDIFYLSCRDVTKALRLMGARSVEGMLISEQHRFAKVKPGVPFFKQVKGIERLLTGMDFKGRLCLIGTGVAGKHLGNIIRNRGGMVLDLGSVFDLWAGVESRSWIKEELKV